MSLTLTSISSHITHAIGGGTLASQLSATQIANEAGRMLHMLHGWKCFVTVRTLLSLTASQAYVALPSNFSQLISVEMTDGFNASIQLVTLEELNEHRNDTTTSSFPTYYAAVHWPTQANATSVPGAARLELSPTPSANDTDAIAIDYRRTWTELSSGSDVPNIPLWMESLYLRIVRDLARSYEDTESLFDVETLRGSGIFAMAQQNDGMVQQRMGMIRGGHGYPRVEANTNLSSYVADPS